VAGKPIGEVKEVVNSPEVSAIGAVAGEPTKGTIETTRGVVNSVPSLVKSTKDSQN
jgi:hypothetical protein